MTSKTCFKCGQQKPLSDFYKHKMMFDGRLNKCKSCTCLDNQKNRDRNIERYREYDRNRAKPPERRKHALTVASSWKSLHPERRAAQVALNNAVRDGKLNPWPVCAIPECNSKPEAHHTDYNRPLDVVWLCAAHHKQAHAMARKEAINHKEQQ